MSQTSGVSQRVLFFDGPPHRFESWLGLITPGRPRVARRAMLVAAVAWLPLALLTALHGDFIGPDHANTFLLDMGALARFLIAAPLLVAAESLCPPHLAEIARQFVDGGLVTEMDRPAYDRAVDSSWRLLRSPLAEIVTFLLVYVLIATLIVTAPPVGTLPAWHGSFATGALSPAGWWGVLVSLPVLLLLLVGWLWRVVVWTRFLWLMSGLKLQLVPSHPDRAAGLRFVGSSLWHFLPLSFAFGVIAAGAVANRVLHDGASPLDFKYLCLGVAAFAVTLFGAPLLVFGRTLSSQHHRGQFEYGPLARRVGDLLECRWLYQGQCIDEQALQVQDFGATNALNAITANVYAMRRVPIERRDLTLVALAAILPFVPIALLTVPPEELVRKLAELLL